MLKMTLIKFIFFILFKFFYFCSISIVDILISNKQTKKSWMNDFWNISHSCKIVEMKISDNKKWHFFPKIFCLLRVVPLSTLEMCSMGRWQKDKQHWNDLHCNNGYFFKEIWGIKNGLGKYNCYTLTESCQDTALYGELSTVSTM
jgi:hypothetical protein